MINDRGGISGTKKQPSKQEKTQTQTPLNLRRYWWQHHSPNAQSHALRTQTTAALIKAAMMYDVVCCILLHTCFLLLVMPVEMEEPVVSSPSRGQDDAVVVLASCFIAHFCFTSRYFDPTRNTSAATMYVFCWVYPHQIVTANNTATRKAFAAVDCCLRELR